MTTLLTLTGYARIGRLALVAAALVVGIVAFAAPAVTEAAGAAQAQASADVYCSALIFGLFGWLVDLLSGGAFERGLGC